MLDNDKTARAKAYDSRYYLQKLDFLNWYRYYFLVREVLDRGAGRVLEIGSGSGMVKNCLSPVVDEYKVLDINEKLSPDYLGDLRNPVEGLAGRFDCIIAADVLEHMPFEDMGLCLGNIRSYLAEGGTALVTIPHRRSHFLLMTPNYIPHVITVPTGFLSWGAFCRRFIQRKIWIDPDHCWEIGDGNVRVSHVEEKFRAAGLRIIRRQKLLYVDYWILGRT